MSHMVNERPNAEENAYQYIKRKIITRELRPLEQVVETDIVEQTQISRTPIRAAIKRLGYEGLVTIRPNKGAYVVSPSAKEVRDIFACKKTLETEAIRLACPQITEADFQELEDIVAKEAAAIMEKDFSTFLDLNHRYHIVIASASNNLCYIKYIDELMTKSNVFLIFFDDFMETTFEESEAHKEHQRIIQALRSRDVERCVAEMATHSDNTYETLVIR